jgi:hypothetical protein
MAQAAQALFVPAHAERVAEFGAGDAHDPTGTIRLAADRWDLQVYYQHRPGARAKSVSFEGLGALEPYAKWYILDRILVAGRSPSGAIQLASALRQAARTMERIGARSIDDLAAPDVFDDVWASLAGKWIGIAGERPRSTVWRQQLTSPFWRALRSATGAPTRVPPVLPFRRPSIGEIARHEERVIPPAVVRQLGNRLALHRDGRDVLDSRDLLRLSVLLLHISLGRRISEILLAPRGMGRRGPLVDYATTTAEEALGFRFAPSKRGVDDIVYVSPEWRDLVEYCVATLVALGDEVRPWAEPEHADLLILVSGLNGTRTRGGPTRLRTPSTDPLDYAPGTALSYTSFRNWLNGASFRSQETEGALSRWHITESGRPSDPVYVLRTHAARHTRQSVLMTDPAVSRLAAQRDLNTASREIQSVYQHGLSEQNTTLRRRAGAGELIAQGATWVAAIETGGYVAGEPRLVAEQPRILALLAANPDLIEFNRVPTGYCVRPQGPAACPEFLQCVEATDAGCAWFATDPSDERCLEEIADRASHQRSEATCAQQAGQVVLAGKLATLARRAEDMRDRTLAAAPEVVLAKMRERLALEDEH